MKLPEPIRAFRYTDLSPKEANKVAEWLMGQFRNGFPEWAHYMRVCVPLENGRYADLRDEHLLGVVVQVLRVAAAARFRMSAPFRGPEAKLIAEMGWTDFGEAMKAVVETHLTERERSRNASLTDEQVERAREAIGLPVSSDGMRRAIIAALGESP